MKVLIFTPDIPQYNTLRRELENISRDYDVIGPLTSNEAARDYLTLHHDTDIAIANTTLYDGAVFPSLDALQPDTPVIFIADTPEHAYQAFRYHSLAYLLTPFAHDDLVEALRRTQALQRKQHRIHLAPPSQRPQAPAPRTRQRFLVKTYNGERVVPITNVRYIFSHQHNTYLRLLDNTTHLIDGTLQQIAATLNPATHLQVNRTHIVPIEQVLALQAAPGGTAQLLLRGTPHTSVHIPRTRKQQVRKWIENR